MSNLSEKDKKFLEKQIAKKVRNELDKEDFEDTAWLKAFSEAKGKKDQAKVNYIDIRSQDLWDAEIENFESNEVWGLFLDLFRINYIKLK